MFLLKSYYTNHSLFQSPTSKMIGKLKSRNKKFNNIYKTKWMEETTTRKNISSSMITEIRPWPETVHPGTPDPQQHSQRLGRCQGWGWGCCWTHRAHLDGAIAPSPYTRPPVQPECIFPEVKTGHFGDMRHRGYSKVLRWETVLRKSEAK